MQVDRVGVNQLESAHGIDRADDRVVARRIDDRVGVIAHGAQRHPGAREVRPGPVGPPVDDVRLAGVIQRRQHVAHLLAEGGLIGGGHRQLVRRTRQLLRQDVRVVRIDARRLGGPPEQVTRAAHEVLVDRVVVSHEHHQRRRAAATRTARLLPDARQRGRRAHQYGGIEPADVDAELERVRAHHAAQRAREQRLLDGPALLGQIAAAIRFDALVQRWLRRPQRIVRGILRKRQPRARAFELLACVAVDQLGADARLRERDRLRTALDDPGEQLAALDVRTAALDLGVVPERRVPEHEVLLATRRAVVVDHRDLTAGECRGQLTGVADGGAAQHVAELAAVVAHESFEPAQHERHVTAEDAAVRMHLVDDHIAQVAQETRPLGVLRQDAGVQHVGIRQDEVRLAAQFLARARRRVAIVDAGVQHGPELQSGLRQTREALQLILRQRLGGEQVERGRARLLEQALECRQVEAQ